MKDTGAVKGAGFITQRAQIKFIIHFCISVLISAVIFAAIFYLYTYKELGSSHSQALLTLMGLRHDILPAMLLTGGIVVVFSTLAVLIITLLNSHKIAGPVYRLERRLESMGGFDLSTRIRFRKGDAVNGLAEGLNSASKRLDSKISEISRELKDVREEAERIRANPGGPTTALMEKIGLARKAVSEFKTE